MRNHLAVVALGIAVALTPCLVAAAPAGATGPGLVHYSVHADAVVTQALDAAGSPCGTPGVVTVDQHVNAAVVATEAGLTDAEVLALLDDDPDQVVQQVTATKTGTVVYVTAGHVYTGTFTSWFGGQFLPNGMYVQTGTFSLRTRSELGTLLRINSGGHDVDGFDGNTKVFNQHGSVVGCLV